MTIVKKLKKRKKTIQLDNHFFKSYNSEQESRILTIVERKETIELN